MATVGLEGLGKLKKSTSSGLDSACRIVTQPTTLDAVDIQQVAAELSLNGVHLPAQPAASTRIATCGKHGG
jgi:hypothetical protein